MEQPEVDRGALFEEMRREQSDWEDWRPTDCDFWTAMEGEDDEDSGD